MASREMRRIRERLAGKAKKDDKGLKKVSSLTIPSVILIGLVLIGLVWWGRSSNASGVSVTFGSYDGRPIVWSPGNYFARLVAELKEAPNYLGQKLDDETAVRYLLPYMIFHTAAMVEAEKNGLTVSDAEVEEYIKMSGELDRYNKAEATERHDLFQVFKEQLIELKLLQGLIQTYENQALQNDAAGMGTPEKKFRYVQWKYDDYPMQEIAKFAAENKDLFRSIKLSRIVAKTESEAKDAYNKITSHQSTFDDIAKESKAGSDTPSELDWQFYYDLQSTLGSKEAADKIFALKQGEISDVLTFGNQWFIYRCDQEAKPADLSAPDTITKIKSYILQYQKGRVESFFETEANQFLKNAQSGGLTAAAAGARLKTYETGYFPINYSSLPFLKEIPDMKDPTTSIADAQSESVFFKEAFALKKGALSKPILLRDLVVICELVDERTPTQADLDKIKTTFKTLENRDLQNFYYFIADRLYVRGMPLILNGQTVMTPDPFVFHQYLTMGYIRMQQVVFDSSRERVELDFNPATSTFYNEFVDLEKMGPRADREDAMAAGLEAYHKLFAPKS
jgi:parvulin-like peptidyl-prolyl isomerase